MNIVACSNNDMALVAWTFDRKIKDCLGFAVYRLDVNAGTEICLPAMATFPGQEPTKGRTTANDPVQKFFWKDVYARRGGMYKYKVVPMTGAPTALHPMPVGPLISNAVSLTPMRGLFSAYFNRGILATQATAHALPKSPKTGTPSQLVLKDNIKTPGNVLRGRLAGQMIEALLSLLRRAEKEGGECYCALYELNDRELLDELKKLSNKLHIVLANLRDHPKGQPDNPDVDKFARDELQATNADKHDRILNAGQIGHNKFVVYVNGEGARAVLLGSTNWTSTGLCAQTNNSLIVESPALADVYLTYWKRLKDDTDAAKEQPKAFQGTKLRTQDQKQQAVKLEDNSALLDIWFSPNMPSLRASKPTSSEKRPPDISQVFDLIASAKQAVLFLAFQPGSPSIIDAAAEAQKQNPDLFVRGALTNADAAAGFSVELRGQEKLKRTKGGPKLPPAHQDPRVISARGIDDPFGVWEKELNSAGHAVIHDKIVVIDPFSRNCVVITGSHNLGYRASYNNDENMAIIRGHRPLAEAYATHVLDVYDHYSWRYWLQEKGDAARHLLDIDDSWQDKYFDDQGHIKAAQLKFWLSAVPSGMAQPNTTDGLSSTRPPIPVTSDELVAPPSPVVLPPTPQKRRKPRKK